jgi:hypothetical protein
LTAERVDRRLAAVLAADVAGYSRAVLTGLAAAAALTVAAPALEPETAETGPHPMPSFSLRSSDTIWPFANTTFD